MAVSNAMRCCALVWATILARPLLTPAAPPSSAWPTVWFDEFDGAALDEAKWQSGALPWGGRHHTDDYASYIMPEDAYLRAGSLWLRCRKAAGNEFGGYPYSEGFIHSDGRMNYTYGYVEIRARFPAGRGLWPAFWTLSWGWPPEFDIAEYFGSDNRMHLGLAYGSSWQDVQWTSSNLYEDFTPWRTYGLEWGPGYAIWRVDGVVRKSIYGSNVPSSPMYILLNSGMRWDADGSTPFPNTVQIDYCRRFDLPAVRINDNSTGTGVHLVSYRGAWDYTASEGGAYFSDNHWSSRANDFFEVPFEGTRVDLYGALDPGHGIAAVSIDQGPETLVDYYAPMRRDQALVWSSRGVASGSHRLRVRVTGSRNPSSTGTAVTADRLDVWTHPAPLTGTVIGTAGSWNSSGNVREHALDGDLLSFFDGPGSGGGWVGLDFGPGQQAVLTEVRFCPRPNYATRMLGGVFQGAHRPDFSNATTLHRIESLPSEGRLSVQALAGTSGFRYVRYLSPVASYGNVAELEFYGSVEALPPPELTATYDAAALAVTLSWPDWAADYGVDRASSLTPALNWEAVSEPVRESAGLLHLTLPFTSEPPAFFRLHLRQP